MIQFLKIAFLPLMAVIACFNSAQADGKTLNVYTYDSFASDWGPGPAIKKSFEAKCDCTLNWVTLEDAVSILSRLQLEGSDSSADIVLGLDMNLLEEAKKTGLFAPHAQSINNLELPIDWADDTFIPFDYGYFAFIYDETKLATPPSSLKELVEGKDDLKIIIQDPRTSTPGLGLMLWVQKVYGDKANEAWAKLAPKLVTVTKGWSEAYSMFLEGEADMVLSYTTSPAYHMIAEDKSQYKAAAFEEGHYMQVEVGAKVASTKNNGLADKFLTFITTPDFQNTIPTGNWMFPAAKTSEPLNSAFSKLVTPAKTLIFKSGEVMENRKAWTSNWLNAVSQ